MGDSELHASGATVPGQVVDTHVHLITVGLLEEHLSTLPPEAMPRFREMLKQRKFGRRGDPIPELSPAEAAQAYAARLDAVDVAKALVVSIVPDSEWMREFVSAGDGRLHALCNLDPRDPGAPALLEREMAAGFKGIKLLPVNRCYRLSDPECRPLLEKAAELGANFIIHYGVSVDPGADLRYADPLDLSPVARDFPEITFVIAHFGAGWFEEVLKLAYARSNVCVDSSGTNNWRDFLPYELSLADIFSRSVGALGAERVLFGTDSNNAAPYREWIKFQQMRTLEEIGLSAEHRDLILRANAVRIFGLDQPPTPDNR